MRSVHWARVLRERRLLVAAIGLYLALAAGFSFVTDDAYISFRYARNWAAGNGVRFNLGVEPPVEGYTNFGWVALAAGCEAVGIPPWAALPVLSVCCGVVLLLLVHRTIGHLGLDRRAADAAVLALALSPPMVVWATGGLATMPHALLVFLTFERLVVARSRGSLVHAVLAGIALALIRFEGMGWVVILASVGFAVRGPGRAAWFLGACALGWAPYYAWRTVTYGDWLPNTARIKVGLGWESGARGLRYVVSNAVALVFPLPFFLGLPAALRRHRDQGLAVGVMAIAFPVYSVVVGGDFMAMGRLLVPSLPFAAMLLGWGVHELLARGVSARRVGLATGAVLLVGTLPLMGVPTLPAAGRAKLTVRHGALKKLTEFDMWLNMRRNSRRWYQAGLDLRELSQPGDSLVAGGIGAVAYSSGLFIYDQNGLVTLEVARHPPSALAEIRMPGHDRFVTADFFLDHGPTFLRAEIVYPGEDEGTSGEPLPPPERRAVRRAMKKVGKRYAVRTEWVPDLVPRGDHWLLLLRRAEPGEDVGAAWERFYPS